MIFAEAVTELAMYTEFREAVGVPILANITEFGQTPLFTREELDGAGVEIVLYCCAAYRAMNAAALKVYEAIRAEGTQKSVVALMQTREELYRYLDYHAYEAEAGRVVRERQEVDNSSCHSQLVDLTGGHHERNASRRPRPSNPRSPSLSPAHRLATPHSAPWARAATTCTIAATISPTSPRTASLKKWRTCWSTASCPHAAELAAYKASCSPCAALPAGGEAGAGTAAAPRRTRWMCCAPASRCSAACGRRPTTTATLARAPSPTRCWPRSAPCCSTGITMRINGKRIEVETDNDSIAAHFLHLLHGKEPRPDVDCARCRRR